MAATVIENISSVVWTDISAASGLSGFISNSGAQEVVYMEAASLPLPSQKEGHKLQVGESVNYVITVGAIYARTIARGSGVLAVTGE